jgi:hypothetical protein
MGKIEFTCEYCKGGFFDWASQRKGKRNFCSVNCKNENMKTKLTRECKQCRTIFPVTPTDLNVGRGKYCSKECYDEARLKVSECEYCEVTFKSLPSKNRRFCTPKCSTKAQYKKVKRVCIWCEKDFDTSLPTIKKGHGKFCTQTCRANYNLKYNTRYKNWHSLPAAIARDKRKDKWMRKNGYTIIRLSEKDIKDNAEIALLNKLPSLQLSLL